MKHASKVIICGQVCDWEEKAPFVASGMSVLGAVEYDPAEDKLKCHECGKYFSSLSNHCARHGKTAREYKSAHGLNLGSSLKCFRIRDAARTSIKGRPGMGITKAIRRGAASSFKRTNMEIRNTRSTCPAQLIARLKALAVRLGYTPTSAEMRAEGIAFSHAEKNSVRRIQIAAGLSPSERRGDQYDREILKQLLIEFYLNNRRTPIDRDWRSGLLPSPKTYIRYFGSLANAYLAAGLLNAGIREGKAA